MRKQNWILVLGKTTVFLSFFMFALLTAIFLNPIGKSNAKEVTYIVDSDYSVSLAVDDSVTIPITPTSSQTVYTGVGTISYTNTCPSGFIVKISTNSETNDLVRKAEDSLDKTIAAVGSGYTYLTSNSWGYSVGNNKFAPVPVKDSPAVLFETSEANMTAKEFSVTYGVKINSEIPAGLYSNDVLYTVMAKPSCAFYSVEWDMNGGRQNETAEYPTGLNQNTKIDLKDLTPKRDGFVFAGWSNGTDAFGESDGLVDINQGHKAAIKMTAMWNAEACATDANTITETLNLSIGGTKNIDYSGKNNCFTIAKTGYYKIEAWGAQGGTVSYEGRTVTGGYGGYSVGVIKMDESQSLYAVVGGVGGSNAAAVGTFRDGGYNGGGSNIRTQFGVGGTGGGATHFALKPGVLKNLESYKGELSDDKTYYVSREILMVAGGGAAGGIEVAGTRYYQGANGGGYIGNTKKHVNYAEGGNYEGGTQTASTFGGGCEDSSWRGGAGGGWFCRGGGGSGYIGSPNLLSSSTVTKHMICYSCSSSGNAETRTTSNTRVSASALSDYSKSSNGYARITYLGTSL